MNRQSERSRDGNKWLKRRTRKRVRRFFMVPCLLLGIFNVLLSYPLSVHDVETSGSQYHSARMLQT